MDSETLEPKRSELDPTDSYRKPWGVWKTSRKEKRYEKGKKRREKISWRDWNGGRAKSAGAGGWNGERRGLYMVLTPRLSDETREPKD